MRLFYTLLLCLLAPLANGAFFANEFTTNPSGSDFTALAKISFAKPITTQSGTNIIQDVFRPSVLFSNANNGAYGVPMIQQYQDTSGNMNWYLDKIMDTGFEIPASGGFYTPYSGHIVGNLTVDSTLFIASTAISEDTPGLLNVPALAGANLATGDFTGTFHGQQVGNYSQQAGRSTNPIVSGLFWTNTSGYRVTLTVNYILTDSTVSGAPSICMTNISQGDFFNATNSFVLAAMSSGRAVFFLSPGDYFIATNKSSGSASATLQGSFANGQ